MRNKPTKPQPKKETPVTRSWRVWARNEIGLVDPTLIAASSRRQAKKLFKKKHPQTCGAIHALPLGDPKDPFKHIQQEPTDE